MNESVLASPGDTAGSLVRDTAGLGDAIAIVPGLNGTAWIHHASGEVHIDRARLRELLFTGHTVILEPERGAVVLEPVRDTVQIWITTETGRPGLVYLAPRDVIARIARGMIASARFGPVRG